ncbi:MAG: tRNA (adenosine(37)-N6)-threonylcarbamoyltransferase complex dimerization subunit type 1 TsaB [Ktedonobacteraceae bacterium]
MNYYDNFRKTRMLLLALDTSNRHASIALCSEDDVYGEYTWRIDSNHSVELLTRIQRLVAECHTTMSHIQGIAVATGPGSFNGVRVALATAKTLAFVLQKPLFGISTLDIIAAQQQQVTYPLCALMEAGRSELYAACYQAVLQVAEHGDVRYVLTQISPYGVFSVLQIADLIREQTNGEMNLSTAQQMSPFLFCGEISDASRQALATHVQAQGLFLSNAQSTRHASVLASLALQRWQEGKMDDPLLLEPLYLRRPSITTSTRKRPLLGTAFQRPTGQGNTEREEGAVRD